MHGVKRDKLKITTVTQPAFVMPVYDVTSELGIPCERGDAVEFVVFVWNHPEQRWDTLLETFESHADAMKAARAQAGGVLTDTRLRP